MEKNEMAVYTANFGNSVWPKRAKTNNTSPFSKAIDSLLGSHQCGLVISPEIMFQVF
jgi:hypothetical protein